MSGEKGSNLIGIQRQRNQEKVCSSPKAYTFDKYNETRRLADKSLDKQRKENEDREMQGVTFHPTINEYSAQLVRTGGETDVLVRTEAWANYKDEKRKLVVQLKAVKEENKAVLAITPLKVAEHRVEGMSKVRAHVECVQGEDMTKTVVNYNKGNYNDGVPSRLQKKLKNWDKRKSKDSEDEEKNPGKGKVKYDDFRMALHKKINKS